MKYYRTVGGHICGLGVHLHFDQGINTFRFLFTINVALARVKKQDICGILSDIIDHCSTWRQVGPVTVIVISVKNKRKIQRIFFTLRNRERQRYGSYPHQAINIGRVAISV
jgi:hypothetical protein